MLWSHVGQFMIFLPFVISFDQSYTWYNYSDSAFAGYHHHPKRELVISDSDCSVYQCGTAFCPKQYGSTHLYTLNLNDPYDKPFTRSSCMHSLRTFSPRNLSMTFVQVDYDCIKVVANPAYFNAGCVLPSKCGKVIYQTLTTSWLGSSTVVCYSNKTASWVSKNLTLYQYDFGTNQRFCDYFNISSYYWYTQTEQQHRLVSHTCVQYNQNVPKTIEYNTVTQPDSNTVSLHISGTMLSDKICRQWDSYSTQEEAIFSMAQWFYQTIDQGLPCVNLNMTFQPVLSCHSVETQATVDRFLTPIYNTDNATWRADINLARITTTMAGLGHYVKCSPFDVVLYTDKIDIHVSALTTSFFEMFKNLLVIAFQEIFDIFKKSFSFTFDNVTLPLFEDILLWLAKLIKYIAIKLYPILLKYYFFHILFFYIYVYFHYRDHFISIVLSVSLYLVILFIVFPDLFLDFTQ